MKRISVRLSSHPHSDVPDRVIVIGHKNPDTDSIAAATGYAELKSQLGWTGVSAACAGLPGERTEFLFNRFNVALPPVLTDVHPRVSDVLDSNPQVISAGHTLLEAMALLQRARRHRIPVVDSKRTYLGMVSLFDLADRLVLHAADPGLDGGGGGLIGREVKTSLSHILEVLRASALSLYREWHVERLGVYVGAMSEATLRRRLSTRDPKVTALVVGDRHEIHKLAVEMKLRLLIVTGNFPVDEKVLQKARAAGTSVLQTPFDSGTTVRRLKFSTPAELMLQEDADPLRADEKLSDLREILANEREEVFPVVDSRGKLDGILTKDSLERDLPLKLILVDHNELGQAVDGAADVPVIEILDHHRIGVQQTQTPITFINEVVGSSCTLVTEQFRRFGKTPPAPIAGILMGGVITDTLMLRSPTSTPRDAAAIEYLKELCGADPKELSAHIFAVGSRIAAQSAREVLTADKKAYNTAKYKFALSQIEEVGFENFLQHRGELLREIKALRREDHLDFVGLLITDVMRETSMMLCAGERRILDRITYTRLDESTFDLPGILSRKKQLLPYLLKVMS
ncbi:MAG TPA: putative manganese-dependent inorganic diphosphatase [Planctomycetota bacterium]|jgi:manganese-dependent inorganic pyrophosphatase